MVAAAEIVTVVPAAETTVAPTGIPVPVITTPTDIPVIEPTLVMFVEPKVTFPVVLYPNTRSRPKGEITLLAAPVLIGL